MFTALLAGTTLTSRPSLLPYTLSQVRPFSYPFLFNSSPSKIMFTAPPASPISTSCAEFLRKRYPSLLLYLPIDAPKTINKNKKSKTYIRMGRAQYRERRTGQKKEKSGRTGRAAIRRRKEEGERKVLAAGGQQRDEQKKRKSQNAPPQAARGQHEQKRRERAAEKAAKSGRGRERRKAPPHPAEPRKGREGREKSGPSPRRRRGKRKY